MSFDADVCIVGAGAGGAVAAWALTRQNLRVVLLEAGPRFDPAEYGTHRLDWENRPSPFQVVSTAPERLSYESREGEVLDPEFGHLASRTPTAMSRRPPRRRRPFYYSRAIGVGGSTLHYQGEAHRFPAHAFRMRSERGVGADWPLGYDDLAPDYERIEHLLGVAGDPVNPFKPARGPYPYPAHPLAAGSRVLSDAARGLGEQAGETPDAQGQAQWRAGGLRRLAGSVAGRGPVEQLGRRHVRQRWQFLLHRWRPQRQGG